MCLWLSLNEQNAQAHARSRVRTGSSPKTASKRTEAGKWVGGGHTGRAHQWRPQVPIRTGVGVDLGGPPGHSAVEEHDDDEEEEASSPPPPRVRPPMSLPAYRFGGSQRV